MHLSCKRHGKTVRQTLSDPAQTFKAKRKVGTFGRFRRLSAELVEVSERL